MSMKKRTNSPFDVLPDGEVKIPADELRAAFEAGGSAGLRWAIRTHLCLALPSRRLKASERTIARAWLTRTTERVARAWLDLPPR